MTMTNKRHLPGRTGCIHLEFPAMETLRHSPIIRTFLFLAAITICIGGLLLLRELEPVDESLTVHGIYDELGHLLTALVAAIGVRALRLPVPMWSVLAGGVILDIGHIPQMYGYLAAIEGSSRNGSHSLAVIITLACLGFIDQRRASIYLGLAIGAVSHLWRDMGTGAVPLMWPLTESVYGTLYSRYIAGLAGMAIAMIGSAGLLDAQNRVRNEDRRQSD